MGNLSHVFEIERLIDPAQRSRIDTVEFNTAFTHELVSRAILAADRDRRRRYFDSGWGQFKSLPTLKRTEATYESLSSPNFSSAVDAERSLLTVFNASYLIVRIVWRD